MVSIAAAEKERVVDGGVVEEALRLLDLGLQAAYAFRTKLTPVSEVSPGQARPLQLRAVGAEEANVVRSCVVPKGHGCLHSKRESHQEAADGTPQRLTPPSPPAEEAKTHWLRGAPYPPPARLRPQGLPRQVLSHLTSTEMRAGDVGWEGAVSHPLPISKPTGGTCPSGGEGMCVTEGKGPTPTLGDPRPLPPTFQTGTPPRVR